MMKALRYENYGPYQEVLQVVEIPKPSFKENEVLVKVHAVTVNRTDTAIVPATYFAMRFFTGLFRPRLKTPGTDFAGEVVAIGASVTNFKVGDRVYGLNDEGLSSQAEFMSISSSAGITKIPKGVSYVDAVASLEGFHYSLNTINKISINKGDHFLVNGASGGIGSATVQLLKYYGAEVTAVTNTKNLDRIKALGADEVIDYLKEDFSKRDQQYHYILDTVGKSSYKKCKPLLLDKGCYISSELGENWANIRLSLWTPFSSLFTTHKKRVKFPIPSKIKDSLALSQQLLREDKYRPLIDRSYPLDDIVSAYRYVSQGEKTGNVIINI